MRFPAALRSAITGEFRLAVKEIYLLRIQLAEIKYDVIRAL